MEGEGTAQCFLNIDN